MEFIPSQKAEFYFGKIEEIILEKNLTPKERIPKLRSIMELLFKELTSDENIIFTTLHSRESYYFNKYTNAPPELHKEIRQFRQFANQVVHNPDLIPNSDDELLCLKILCKAISNFCKEEIPSSLRDLFPQKELTFKIVEPKQTENLSLIFYKILNRYENQNRKVLSLLCEHSDAGPITLSIWYNKTHPINKVDWTEIHSILKPYTNLYVTAVRQDTSQQSLYHTTAKSIIVVEPDFLVDVTEIAECFQNFGTIPFLSLLKRFLPTEPSFALIKGSIINNIFDDFLTNTGFSFDIAFEQALKNRMIEILFLFAEGSENLTKTKLYLEKLKQEIYESHYNALEETRNRFLNMKKLIEPSFISKTFGIQGRLDVLLQSPNEEKQLDIVELKSGNAPYDGMWENHLLQTILYDLLIQSIIPQRRGGSYICYSSSNRPLRTYPGGEWINQQQEAINVRNKIVSYLFRMANGELPQILKENENILNLNLPLYLSNQINDFYNTIKLLDHTEKSYFFGFCKFLIRELIELKIGNNSSDFPNDGYSSLWRKTISEKKDTFSILDNLVITSIADDASLILQTEDKTPFSTSDFREGDLVLLYPYDGNSTDPTKFLLLQCFINNLNDTELRVQLLNRLTDSEYFRKYSRWVLEHGFRESNFISLFKSLYIFISSDKQKRDLILGRKQPQFETLEVQFNKSLSNRQQEIIRSALAARDYFLIQGPPGTGKTSVIMKELVRQLHKRNENILLIAYTNRAVDEICSRLLEIDGLSYIRMGKGQDTSVLFSELSRTLTIEELSQKVEQTQVFVSTQASLVNNSVLLKLKSFDTLIVDEASQLLEPHLLGILPRVKRFILIGDEKQLPPVVVQNKEQTLCEDTLLKEIALENYSESIFTRLLKNAKKNNWSECYTSLVDHYRMHRDIAKFINDHYYDSILKETLNSQTEKISFPHTSDELDKILSTNRLVFISVPAEPFKHKVNEKEARIVSLLAKRFYNLIQLKRSDNFNHQSDIGIITPFRAQISAIKNLLPTEIQNITVDTVERFQGSERRIIIISFAFKSILQAKMIQSLYIDKQEVERKLNVAVSRPREHLVIVGDHRILEQDTHYRKLLDHIKKYGKTLDYEEILKYTVN